MYNSTLKLREAVLADAKLLFDWANDEEVRYNSIHQEPILWDDHLPWIKMKLGNPACRIFILENNNIPVGQIRIDLNDSNWLIDYSVGKDHRGKGFGKELVQLLLEQYPAYTFGAIVKQGNTASQKIFEKLGFSDQHSADDSLKRYLYQKNKVSENT